VLLKPTTFVLGAGASVDMGFPTGAELQGEVIKSLRPSQRNRGFGNEKIREAIQLSLAEKGDDRAAYAQSLNEAARNISRAMTVAASIDNYLHTHSKNLEVVTLGKLAIAQSIIDAESKSFLSNSQDSVSYGVDILAKQEFQKSWYAPFLRMLTSGTLSDDPVSLFRNAKFIVFNYDRCLEVVFLAALQSYFNIDIAEAANVLAEVDIIHPYGSLGPLPPLARDGIGFGTSDSRLLMISQSIKTFTESVDTEIADRAKKAVTDAETVVFLGFGFLAQNMKLIEPDITRKTTRIHATTVGISESDKLVVASQLSKFIETGRAFADFHTRDPAAGIVDVTNTTCRNLIENHRIRLLQA
jgi:hypothetical protein